MLRLTDINAGYDTGIVLRGVDLVVPDGKVVALIGPNGSGKTTLLRVASGLLEPTSGRVEVDGHDLTGQPAHVFAKRGVCHIPEGRGIFPALTVADNLRLQAPPRLERGAAERASQAFPILRDRLMQLAGTMSGGQQQMLALAAAYVSEPQIALLDEVSMGLAPKVVDEIFEYLKVLSGHGKSLLLVEQYVTRALEMADLVYVLRRGRIEFAGEARELSREDVLRSYLGETVP